MKHTDIGLWLSPVENALPKQGPCTFDYANDTWPQRHRTLSQRLTAGAGSHLVADATREEGGKAQGPTPGELLASALSACTCIKVQMYAARKQWPLQEVEAVVSFVMDERHVVTLLERELHLHGELSPDQRQRLLKVSEQCPIHKTLAPAVTITTRLVE